VAGNTGAVRRRNASASGERCGTDILPATANGPSTTEVGIHDHATSGQALYWRHPAEHACTSADKHLVVAPNGAIVRT
jgi:hypothetical protein